MFFSKAAVVATLFFVRSAFSTPSCARSYTVQEGDWCDTISAKNNVSTYQLAVTNLNTIDKNCDNLMPGESLCLGFTGQDCTNTYVIQPDDECSAIASNHGVNTTMLFLNNPQINADCDNIYIGEVLCIGSNVAVPSLPAGSPVPAATPPPGAVPANPTVTAFPTSTVAPTSTPTPAPAPAASDDGDDDDGDCDDGDDDETTTTTATTATPTTSSSTTASSTITSAPSATAADDDDEDLPWCD